MTNRSFMAAAFGVALGAVAANGAALASSHMDAPLITFDDPANTTDVYAFRSQSANGKLQYLTTALAVYPFEEPGIGPNNYRFDDRVRYEIHVALDDDVAKGRKSITYRFEFNADYANQDTILQSYLGEVQPVSAAPDLQGHHDRPPARPHEEAWPGYCAAEQSGPGDALL